MSKSEKLNLLSAHISKGLCERILTLSAAETALATEDSDTQSEDDDVRDRCTIQPQTMFVRRKGWVTINFTASWGGSHFLTKNIKGGLGDFTFMLIGIPPAHHPLLKNECSLTPTIFVFSNMEKNETEKSYL